MHTDTLREDVEKYRIKWEAKHNRKVDVTKHYTSMWPKEHQDWMIGNDIQRYYDGLPEFLQEFLRERIEYAVRSGFLDDLHPRLIELYTSGGMKKPPARGR